MRKLALGLGAAAALAAFGTAAHAATANGTLNVTFTVTKECTVTTPVTLDFGSKGLLTTNTDATVNLDVLCTKGTDYDIALDKGSHGPNVTTRRMQGGGTDVVNYSLYRDAGHSQNWGETIGVDVVHDTGTGSTISSTIFGRIPIQTSVTPDTYTDTVAITVTY